MPPIEYLRYLTNIDRIRHYHRHERGKVIEFSLQYEAYIQNRWQSIIRYDTSHEFAHKDIIYPDGTKRVVPFYTAHYDAILVEGEADLLDNWQKYRKNFERRLKSK